MRWQRLFDDLEGQAAAGLAAERDAEVAERSRAELGGLTLTNRIAGSVGRPLRFGVRGSGPCAGVLRRVGVDWVLLVDGQDRELLLATTAITMVTGLGRETVPAGNATVDGAGAAGPGRAAAAARVQLAAGWDLRKLVRGLARDRAELRLTLIDGTVLHGTIDRVGSDYLELAEHPVGEARRRDAVRAVATVVIGAIATVGGG